jgi:hypothetical protein
MQEERDESKKKFKDKFSQRFNRHARQYITEYEGTDDTDDFDSIDKAISNFIIDCESPEPREENQAELFITSCGDIQH